MEVLGFKETWTKLSLASRMETLVVGHPSLPLGLEGLTSMVKVREAELALPGCCRACLHPFQQGSQEGKAVFP